jgi:hypothetical protein
MGASSGSAGGSSLRAAPDQNSTQQEKINGPFQSNLFGIQIEKWLPHKKNKKSCCKRQVLGVKIIFSTRNKC